MIRNVVFDVGGVLVRLRYQPFIRYLQDAGVDLADLPAWLATIELEAHERGEITGEELLDRVAASASRPLDRDDLGRRWLDMFERTGEMFELAAGLMGEYRVYLLSNVASCTGGTSTRRTGSRAWATAPSHRSASAQSSRRPRSTARPKRRFALDPAATVFIDDLKRNVAGARSCGWHAIHHVDPAGTRRELKALGVRMPPPFHAE